MNKKFQIKPNGYGDQGLRYGNGRWGRPYSPSSAAIWDRYNDPHPGDNFRHIMTGHTEQTIWNLQLLAWAEVENITLPRDIREKRWGGLRAVVNYEHRDAPPRQGSGTQRPSTLPGYEVASVASAKCPRCHLHDDALEGTTMRSSAGTACRAHVMFAGRGTR